MKRFLNYLIIMLLGFSFLGDVNAQEYQKNDLIPVDTVATVNTDKFNYIDFSYSSKINDKGNTVINFGSIKNNTLSKVPVSINMLLFDAEKKNIGFLTYCSDKDVSSEYSGYKLNGNEIKTFSINVTNRYFAEEKSPSQVKYIAVMDENKYCQIGGYDKYQGLTINEIVSGKTSGSSNNNLINFSYLTNTGLAVILLFLSILLFIYIGLGIILNTLHKRMYAKSTILAFLPIANFYIMVKMAFGSIVALVFLIIYLLSGVLSLLGITFIASIVNIVSVSAFVVVIIKLFTKKYDLLYFEPSIQNNYVDKDFKPSNNYINNNLDLDDDNTSNKPIDLSYSDKIDDNNSINNSTKQNDDSGTSELNSLYNSINDVKEESNVNNTSSVDVDSLYDSINDVKEESNVNNTSGVDVDSLYDSINTEEDNDDNNDDDDSDLTKMFN